MSQYLFPQRKNFYNVLLFLATAEEYFGYITFVFLYYNVLLSLPAAYSQSLIEQSVQWNEDIGEWQLRCVAYTGNNMRKLDKDPPESVIYQFFIVDLFGYKLVQLPKCE